MRDKTYVAHWYDPKDCFVGGCFDPYVTTKSTHDTLDAAKQAAVKGAMRADFFQGWAGVDELTPDRFDGTDITRSLRNEVWKGKWTGWEEVA